MKEVGDTASLVTFPVAVTISMTRSTGV